MKLMILMILRS